MRQIVGEARVVPIGESAHHVREFFQVRHRLLRFLVERCGFTVYALEAPFTGGRVLADWVEGGPGPVERVTAEGIAMSLGEGKDSTPFDLDRLRRSADAHRGRVCRRWSAIARFVAFPEVIPPKSDPCGQEHGRCRPGPHMLGGRR